MSNVMTTNQKLEKLSLLLLTVVYSVVLMIYESDVYGECKLSFWVTKWIYYFAVEDFPLLILNRQISYLA